MSDLHCMAQKCFSTTGQTLRVLGLANHLESEAERRPLHSSRHLRATNRTLLIEDTPDEEREQVPDLPKGSSAWK
jgi:hypothetical protein